jgi:asparagine synthase (glutamine-hydrolysing)
MLVSSLARQHVTVALSADGGDEAFAGYNKYYFGTIQKKKIDKVPSFLRKSIAAVLQKIPAHKIPYFSRKTLFTTRYENYPGLGIQSPRVDG